MSVLVTLSTTLRNYVQDYQPSKGLLIDFENGLSVMNLAIKIGLPLEDIKVIMLNGKRVEAEAQVADGDRVAFFPAVGGG